MATTHPTVIMNDPIVSCQSMILSGASNMRRPKIIANAIIHELTLGTFSVNFIRQIYVNKK